MWVATLLVTAERRQWMLKGDVVLLIGLVSERLCSHIPAIWGPLSGQDGWSGCADGEPGRRDTLLNKLSFTHGSEGPPLPP